MNWQWPALSSSSSHVTEVPWHCLLYFIVCSVSLLYSLTFTFTVIKDSLLSSVGYREWTEGN